MNITIPSTLSASDFNFTEANCTVAASWGSQYQQSLLRSDSQYDLPFNQTVMLLYGGLSDYLGRNRNVNISQNGPELFYWLSDKIWKGNDSILFDMITHAVVDCKHQYCQSIPYEGFSDLTGLGMVANYFIEAGLVTVYLLILFLAWRRQHLPKKLEKNNFLNGIIVAVQESTRTFLDAAMVFSIALLAATIKFYATILYNTGTPFTSYATVSSSFLSLFSLIPAFLLNISANETLRRGKWRRLVWGFILCLGVAIVGMWFRLKNRFNDILVNDPKILENDELFGSIWEEICTEPELQTAFKIALYVLIGISFGIFIIYTVFVMNVFRVPWFNSSRHPFAQRCRVAVITVITIIGWSGMWASLGVFMYYRHAIGKLQGPSSKDREWNFGQLLALATWVPVGVELICIWWLGPERGLSGQVSKRFKVVPQDSKVIPGENLEKVSDKGAVTSDEEQNDGFERVPLSPERSRVA